MGHNQHRSSIALLFLCYIKNHDYQQARSLKSQVIETETKEIIYLYRTSLRVSRSESRRLRLGLLKQARTHYNPRLIRLLMERAINSATHTWNNFFPCDFWETHEENGRWSPCCWECGFSVTRKSVLSIGGLSI